MIEVDLTQLHEFDSSSQEPNPPLASGGLGWHHHVWANSQRIKALSRHGVQLYEAAQGLCKVQQELLRWGGILHCDIGW